MQQGIEIKKEKGKWGTNNFKILAVVCSFTYIPLTKWSNEATLRQKNSTKMS